MHVAATAAAAADDRDYEAVSANEEVGEEEEEEEEVHMTHDMAKMPTMLYWCDRDTRDAAYIRIGVDAGAQSNDNLK